MEVTQVSLGEIARSDKRSAHSITFLGGAAGTMYGIPFSIKSGGMAQPSAAHWTGAGRIFRIAFRSAGVGPLDQRFDVRGLSDRSFAKCPYCGSANQGGIL